MYVTVTYLNFYKYSRGLSKNDIPPTENFRNILNLNGKHVKYVKFYYYKDDFVGFNAVVSGNYLTVTKLGKVTNNPKFQKSLHMKNNDRIVGFSPADINDRISRYADFRSYPFDLKNINYYSDGEYLKIYDNEFLELEVKSSNFSISFNSKDTREFGFTSLKQVMSFSFITHKEYLYLISTHSIGSDKFTSLHEILSTHKNM